MSGSEPPTINADGLPSAENMFSEVKQAAAANNTQQNPSITAATQPPATPQTPATTPQPIVPLAHSESPDADAIDTYDSYIWLRRYVPKFIALALTAQGLFGIYHSLAFIFIDLPKLDSQLQAHQIDQQTVNTFAGEAMVTFISTTISMMFATHLAFLKSKTAHVLHTIVGVIIFLGNTLLQNYFIEIGSAAIIANLTSFFLNTVLMPFRKL